MRRSALLFLAVISLSTAAFAQIQPTRLAAADISFAPVTGQGTQASQPSRGGFTILVNLGLGIQNDTYLEETATGLAGANLGIGAFLTPKLAILGRFSGSNVTYDAGFGQVSGVFGATVQYWASDRVIVEGGAGSGFWSSEGEKNSGFGLIVGASAVVFTRGKHNLLVGVEYAPAFTDPGSVHNFGITFGYQFHLR